MQNTCIPFDSAEYNRFFWWLVVLVVKLFLLKLENEVVVDGHVLLVVCICEKKNELTDFVS